ncbi:TPA: hypothetical protein JK728_004596 [Escherichia coli]|nr:hypothetical protein [Escherichia coli]
MIKTRFSRWLTFFTFAAAVALALPAKANTWPLPPAGSRLVGENKFHVVENDGGSLDAPRDKCTLSCAINGIHAAFHYLKKNYISGCVMTVPTG